MFIIVPLGLVAAYVIISWIVDRPGPLPPGVTRICDLPPYPPDHPDDPNN